MGEETVRYYQRRGLLAEPERGSGQVRRYGADAVARLGDLQRVRAALKEMVERCDTGRERRCPIIESLARPA